MKRSRNSQVQYFNAELVDCDEGALPARIVAFDPAQHQQFVSHATVKDSGENRTLHREAEFRMAAGWS